MTARIFLPICIALLLSGEGAISASQTSGREKSAAARAAVDSICSRQPLARSVVSILALTEDGDTLACDLNYLFAYPAYCLIVKAEMSLSRQYLTGEFEKNPAVFAFHNINHLPNRFIFSISSRFL